MLQFIDFKPKDRFKTKKNLNNFTNIWNYPVRIKCMTCRKVNVSLFRVSQLSYIMYVEFGTLVIFSPKCNDVSKKVIF